MNVLPVDLEKFLATHKALDHVKYGLGAKAVPLKKPATQIARIDCSGYVRYQIYHSADNFMFPDGSWIQRAECEKLGLERVGYSEAASDKSGLFLAFYTAGVNGVGKVGHVLFLHGGRTYESYSGAGVASLPASNPWRREHVHKVFAYPTKAQAAAPVTYALLQSNGAFMAQLPVFNGHSYAPARSWATWQNETFHWDAKTRAVYLGGQKLDTDSKLIGGQTYVPFTVLAARSGVAYLVDNAKREIYLQAKK